MKRRSLRYTDDKSDKFWRITLDGAAHTVSYGRAGTKGQTQRKAFDSEKAAEKSFDKLLKAKLKKGYADIEKAAATAAAAFASVEVKYTPTLKSASEAVSNQPSVSAVSTIMPKDWQATALAMLSRELKQGKKQLCELAAIDAIPEPYFSILNVEVRKAIAAQPCTPIHYLEKLTTDKHNGVRSAVARNASVPPDCLEILAQDDSQDVRYALTRNLYAPISALRCLIGDPYEKVIKSACENPNVTETLLEQLSEKLNREQKHTCGWKRREAKEKRDVIAPRTNWDRALVVDEWDREKLPAISWKDLTLERFAQYGRLDICQTYIAQDPRAPVRLLEKLAENDATILADAYPIMPGWFDRSLIQEAVACNPSTPADILRQLADTNNLFVCLALARNPHLPEDIFERLFNNDSYLYAYNVHGSNRTWSDCKTGEGSKYEKYLGDLRWEIARNPNTPDAIIESLTQCGIRYISDAAKAQSSQRALAVIRGKEVSLDELKGLLRHRDVRVRAAAAQHENGLPLFLKACLRAANTLSKYCALLHPECDARALSRASKSDQWIYRYAVSQNKNASEELLTQLADDESVFVQAAAKTALGITFETEETSAHISQSSAEAATFVEEVRDDKGKASSDKASETLEIKRTVTLSSQEQQWVTWHSHQPLALPVTEAFNLLDCEDKLAKVKRSKWDWESANLSIAMSKQEAHYWIAEMLLDSYRPKLDIDTESQSLMTVLAQSLGTSAIPYHHQERKLSPAFIIPLQVAFGLGKVVKQLVEFANMPSEAALEFSQLPLHSVPYHEHKLRSVYDRAYKQHATPYDLESVYSIFTKWVSDLTRQVVIGFGQYVYPFVSASEIQSLAEEISPIFAQPIPPSIKGSLFHLAAFLGMCDIVAREVSSWTTATYYSTSHHINWPVYAFPSLLLRLESLEQVESNLRRIGFSPRTGLEVKLCLATTGFSTGDLICKRIACAEKHLVNELMSSWIDTGTAPEMAPYMLELTLGSKVSKAAMQWLEFNFVCAIVGLIPVAANAGSSPAVAKRADLVDAAQRFLVGQMRKGRASIVTTALKTFPESTASKITQSVLEHSDLNVVAFNETSTPLWLKQMLATLPTEASISVSSADLSHIVIGQRCLTLKQSQQVLHALELSTLDSPLACITELKKRATQASLDNFAWSLFERWLTQGSNSKEKWQMHALGLLGSDEIALKLTPIIRKWPGESQHGKAKVGLECLRAIGSDTALMQINGIALKIKYKALKKRAQECMADIARDRNFTPQQLEDRIIPDCGLDDKGRRVFDFGPRQFQFVLGPDLKPFVRDEKGKLRTALPKPNQKDNAELAKGAIADWKLMKKQISVVVKLQAARLEQAMVTERRWLLSDFQTLLIGHPLMTHLVQRLIWSGQDAEGQPIKTFRVAEDQTLADAEDEPFEPENVETVSIVHPLRLDIETQADWGESLSDYEIIPPFPQLDREIYTLTKAEENAEEMERFVSVRMPAPKLGRLMQKQSWLKGALHDHGNFSVHYKYFEAADLTAVVGDYENQFVQYMDWVGDDAINACLFLVGHHPNLYDYPKRGSRYSRKLESTCVKLGEVPPLVMSEVIRDLNIVAAAAKE